MKEWLDKLRSKYHSPLVLLLLFFLFAVVADSAKAQKLAVREVTSIPEIQSNVSEPNQLPHSRIVTGYNNISKAWLGGATSRYPHGILGDSLEASKLFVETSAGKRLSLTLPNNRVFEDLEPRLIDIDRDGNDEIMIVESDSHLGASLALYGVVGNQLEAVVSTPFIGRANRWLNPLGVGDFDGDGHLDIALVATPHIGGILRLYRLSDSKLVQYAEHYGVSTHKIGSLNLGLGRVVKGSPKDLLLVPNQPHNALYLLEWTPRGIGKIAEVSLKGRLKSSLIQTRKNHWRFQLENGDMFELTLKNLDKSIFQPSS